MAKAKVGTENITGEYLLESVRINYVANGYTITGAYTRIGGTRNGYKSKTFVALDKGEALSRASKILEGITD